MWFSLNHQPYNVYSQSPEFLDQPNCGNKCSSINALLEHPIPVWKKYLMSNRPIPTKLLVIEDEQDARDLIHYWLQSPNEWTKFFTTSVGVTYYIGDGDWEVQYASSVEEALKLLQLNEFDAILLDLGLGLYTPFETFDIIKKAAGDQPIVVYSNQSEDLVYQYVMQNGAQDFLPKLSVQGDTIKNSICMAMKWNDVKLKKEKLSRALEEHIEVSEKHSCL